MRKSFGVLLAVASLLPMVMIGAAPAGAAGGTKCATSSGAATFTPALPILSSKVLVNSTLAATGTVGKCVGGSVTSGHTTFKQTVKGAGSNCSTLVKPDPKSKGTIGKLVVTWNNGKTSTSTAFTVKQTKSVTTSTTTGKITAGLFVGSTISGSVKYTTPTGACSAKPLAKVTYVQTGAFTIK
jgi:hypothetical protein